MIYNYENKIFNAIQKGIQNALVFDDKLPISYQKSSVNNEMEFPKVSLDELYDIFKDDAIDIFNYNTKDCLSLILDDGQEISLHEYIPDAKPVFLKISNDILKNSGNEIIIACNNNHYIPSKNLQWQTDYEQILSDNFLLKNEQDTINDFNGYKKCQTIINIVENNSDLGNIPAIKYCDNIKSPLPFYKGYLPSIGQLNFILKYLDIINYIFEYVGFDILNLSAGSWWSSSEYSNNFACCLDNGGTYYGSGKVYCSFAVLPLFAFEK